MSELELKMCEKCTEIKPIDKYRKYSNNSSN